MYVCINMFYMFTFPNFRVLRQKVPAKYFNIFHNSNFKYENPSTLLVLGKNKEGIMEKEAFGFFVQIRRVSKEQAR